MTGGKPSCEQFTALTVQEKYKKCNCAVLNSLCRVYSIGKSVEWIPWVVESFTCSLKMRKRVGIKENWHVMITELNIQRWGQLIWRYKMAKHPRGVLLSNPVVLLLPTLVGSGGLVELVACRRSSDVCSMCEPAHSGHCIARTTTQLHWEPPSLWLSVPVMRSMLAGNYVKHNLQTPHEASRNTGAETIGMHLVNKAALCEGPQQSTEAKKK